MIRIILLSVLATLCYARPDGWLAGELDPSNIVTVPPNCPPGQEWINGACRDIWLAGELDPSNIITVPPNCPPGQEWINGACRDVWLAGELDPSNIITVPPNCPPGQQWINGMCREVWPFDREPANYFNPDTQNMITVPPNCKPGQQWINGACRDVWRDGFTMNPLNMITVPQNCPPGQQYINGACRDIWFLGDIRQKSKILTAIFKDFIQKDLNRTVRQADVEVVDNVQNADDASRNIISVPNQCPNGYKPDALGVCREIYNFL